MRRLLARSVAAAIISLASASAVFSNQATQQHNSSAFWFENWGQMTNATLKVLAPNGAMTEIQAAAGTPVFRLDPAQILDGVYRFELTAAKPEKVKIVNPQNNGRGDAASDEVNESFYLSGQFVVDRGVIVAPEETTEDSK
ncbi:hypothetical protein [uncultured Litoreibacter sp.]|uniref:hypothetical protein n=1 Tax=uncultured Litoreibacter sp. TaxID=1392394 RepID=UPI00262C8F94|nr:hypothetical protein [uncultured Litoreibacter sp.]